MEFIETSIFTKRIQALLTDDEYRELQQVLAENPKAGEVIPGGGGLRKIRWRARGQGKRGGIRVIYFCESAHRLYMIYAFGKSEQADLTKDQLQALRAYVKEGVL